MAATLDDTVGASWPYALHGGDAEPHKRVRAFVLRWDGRLVGSPPRPLPAAMPPTRPSPVRT